MSSPERYAIPVYLWLEDDGGAPIKGSVDVNGREGSIEVSELMHSVEQPTDPLTGKATAKRLHSSYAFMKSVDNSSAY
ncbi:type VI secretion system tube protein Hcp, partial [Salmonella enterica]|nr:type VI secretion system tube protein Hcp [Salmonella enterica]